MTSSFHEADTENSRLRFTKLTSVRRCRSRAPSGYFLQRLFLVFYFVFCTASAQGAPDSIAVEAFVVELGKQVTIPSAGPSRHIITTPNIIEIIRFGPNDIEVRADNIGSTMVMVWEEGSRRSIRIKVIPTTRSMQEIEDRKFKETRIYKARQDKSFKFSFEETTDIYYTGKVFARLDEKRKVHDQEIHFSGHVPIGRVEGDILMEYRKDDMLMRSVTRPREMQFRLMDHNLPVLKGHKVIVGSQYMKLHDFSFPDERFGGIAIVPEELGFDESRSEGLYVKALIGRERDGSTLDNAANILDRKEKDKFAAFETEYYLAKETKVGFGMAQRWAGPKNGQSDQNFHATYEIPLGNSTWWGELGRDDRNHHAARAGFEYTGKDISLEGRWRNINKHFRTIHGGVGGAGDQGFDGRVTLYPFAIGDMERWEWETDADVYRDRLSINPLRSKDRNIDVNSRLSGDLPGDYHASFAFAYSGRMASQFPYMRKNWSGQISKTYPVGWSWLQQIALSGRSGFEQYREAEETPGFNSDRFRYGFGLDIIPFDGWSVSFTQDWFRLEEKEPAPLPAKTHPREQSIGFNYSHEFKDKPLRFKAGMRYIGSIETLGKLHESIPSEDRLSVDVGLEWKVFEHATFFANVNTIGTKSHMGNPKTAELTFLSGLKWDWDSEIYIPDEVPVSGMIFMDRNGDGKHDDGEEGIGDVVIFLNDEEAAATDIHGAYYLSVPEGVHKIHVSSKLPDGLRFSTPSQKTLEMIGGDTVRINFGVSADFMVQGRFFVDNNANGVYDDIDKPLVGIRVGLDTGQVTRSTGLGYYSILHIPAGLRTVQIDIDSVPTGYRTLTSVSRQFEGKGGTKVVFDAAFAAERSVQGFVYEDENRDEVFNDNETVFPGIEVQVGDQFVQANKKGRFIVRDLGPGDHEIRINPATLPAGYVAVRPLGDVLKVPDAPLNRRNFNLGIRKSE